MTDYRIEALSLLLRADCLPVRYHPLVALCESVTAGLLALGCKTKSDAARQTDEALLGAGLADPGTVALFRRFLTLYDPRSEKKRELAAVTDPERREAMAELMLLPGVRLTRATLYYEAGFRSLADLASSTEEEVLSRTARCIARGDLPGCPPLPKEVRTHIAVARAFGL